MQFSNKNATLNLTNSQMRQINSTIQRPKHEGIFKGVFSKKKEKQKIDITQLVNLNGEGLKNLSQVLDDNLNGNEQDNLFDRHNIFVEIGKKRPLVAKEKLYEESIHLKNQLKELKEENSKLEIQLCKFENSKQKYQNVISQVEDFVEQNKGQKISLKESSLVINLKKQLQKLKTEIDQKKSTIISLNRNHFSTAKNEYQIMMKYYQEYSEKYRSIRNKSKKNQNQPPNLKLIDLKAEYKVLLDINDQSESQKDTIERKVAHSMIKMSQIKEDLKEKENDIEFIKAQIQLVVEQERKKKEKEKNQKNQQKLKKSTKLPNNEEKELQDIKRLKDPSYGILREKDMIIFDNQKKILQLKLILQERTNFELNSKTELSDELSNLRQIQKSLEDKFDILNIEIDELNEDIPIKQFPDNYGKYLVINKNILQKNEEMQLTKVPKVVKDQILIIAKEIKLRLTLKEIDLNKALKKLFTNKQLLGQSLNQITIQEISERLKMSPFSMQNENDILLFARYLIEDNQEEYVYLNLQHSNNYKVIRSIFRNLIGQLNIISEEEEYYLWNSLSSKITQFQQALQENAQMYGKGGYLNSEGVIKCLYETFNEKIDQEFEYIIMRLFESSNNYKQLDIKKLFEIFDTNNWQSRQERKQIYEVYLQDGDQITDEVEKFPTEINQSLDNNTNQFADNEISPIYKNGYALSLFAKNT